MGKKTGDEFQKETKYERGKLSGRRLDWSRKPKTYKNYPDSPRIKLPEVDFEGGAGIWSVLSDRRSVRRFRETGLSSKEISRLLWSCQGVSAIKSGHEFRTAPSAGALYPVETYLILNRSPDLDSGIYHYSVGNHSLEQLRKGDFASEAKKAALDQESASGAPAVFVWTGVFERSKWKYEQRAYRYVYLDVGHIAQNLALAAVALDLGSCQIGAFYDQEVNQLIGVDGAEESTLYMTVVGYPG